MRYRKIPGPDSANLTAEHMKELLGIDSEWNIHRIRKHLRGEFHKWNYRVTILPEGEKRDKARKMLDLISEARINYG